MNTTIADAATKKLGTPNSNSGTAAFPMSLSPIGSPMKIDEVKENLSNTTLPTKIILPEDHKMLLQSGVLDVNKEVVS